MAKRNHLSFLPLDERILRKKQRLITDYFVREPEPQPEAQPKAQQPQPAEALPPGQPQPKAQPQEQLQPQPELPASQQPKPSPQPEPRLAQPQEQLPQPKPQPKLLEQGTEDRNGQQPSLPKQEGNGQHSQAQSAQLVALQPIPLAEVLQKIVPRGIEGLKTKKYTPAGARCPRCGGIGKIYISKIGRREYVYIRHRGGDKCYLGPKDGYYVVQKILGHLSLTGLRDVNFAEVVASAAEKLMAQIERATEENDAARIAEIIDSMTDIAYVLHDACHALGDRRPHCLEEIAKALFS